METSSPSAAGTARLTLLEWLGFLSRLFWLFALAAAAGFSQVLDLKLAFIFVAWLSYAVLLLFLRPVIHENRTVEWMISSIDLGLAVVLITMSGSLSSPLWSSLLVSSTIIALTHGTSAGVVLAASGTLVVLGFQCALEPFSVWKLLAWSLYLGPVLLSAALIGKVLEQIMGFLNLPHMRAAPAPVIVHHSVGSTLSLFHLAAELNTSLNYDRVITTALELSANALAGDDLVDNHLIGAVLMFEHDQLVIRAESGLTRADRRTSFPARTGLLARAINSGDPCLIESPRNDPELQYLVAVHACQQALAVPLAIGMETYGVLLIAHPMPGYFSPERIDLMEAVGQQVIVALQNARLYRDLEQEKDRIVRIEEEARKKLARDLHDGPTQSIAAIAMRVNFARRLLDRDLPNATAELEKVEDLARKTTREIRHMLFTLRPLILESRGLEAALYQLAEKLHASSTQQIHIDIPQELVGKLDMRRQGILFYITEEALHNAVKHAQAEHVSIKMSSSADFLTLQISDDGVGFNIQAVDRNYDQHSSLGLVNMRERTELLNGLLTIDTNEGLGTRIAVTIPATEEAAESLHRPGLSHEPVENAAPPDARSPDMDDPESSEDPHSR